MAQFFSYFQAGEVIMKPLSYFELHSFTQSTFTPHLASKVGTLKSSKKSQR